MNVSCTLAPSGAQVFRLLRGPRWGRRGRLHGHRRAAAALLDPTPKASQLSRHGSAPRGWKAGQRLSPGGVPPAPTPSQSGIALPPSSPPAWTPKSPIPCPQRGDLREPGAGAGAEAEAGGGRSQGPPPGRPSPCRAAPPTEPPKEGGAGSLGSVSASGAGRAAGGGEAPGTRGLARGGGVSWGLVRGEHFPPPPLAQRSGRGLGRGIWSKHGRVSPPPPTAARGPRNFQAEGRWGSLLLSWGPDPILFPSPPGFPDLLEGRGTDLDLREGAQHRRSRALAGGPTWTWRGTSWAQVWLGWWNGRNRSGV